MRNPFINFWRCFQYFFLNSEVLWQKNYVYENCLYMWNKEIRSGCVWVCSPAVFRLRFSLISSWSHGCVKSKMLCPVNSTWNIEILYQKNSPQSSAGLRLDTMCSSCSDRAVFATHTHTVCSESYDSYKEQTNKRVCHLLKLQQKVITIHDEDQNTQLHFFCDFPTHCWRKRYLTQTQ